MGGKCWALGALMALTTFSTARSACDDFDTYFADVSSVSEINLDVTTVECPEGDGNDLDEILVESGNTLTISTTGSFLQFINVRFTVEDGASLIFDMDDTRFGPNVGNSENSGGYMLNVEEGGSATFTGAITASSIRNFRSVFFNAGTMEIKGDALFEDNGNVFRSNEGTLKFRGNAEFKNNRYLAIDNIGPDAFVRFSKTALFDDNAGRFDGTEGCGVSNEEGTVIFRDDALFSNHGCYEGSAVYNGGKMRFYGKAYFEDNDNQNYNGGGVKNTGGSLIFKGAAQFNRNGGEMGGGLAVDGGEVTFNKAVMFDGNGADDTGGAFAVTSEGSLTFKKPSVVRYRDNYTANTGIGCTLAYVGEDATLVGFDIDDVCVVDSE